MLRVSDPAETISTVPDMLDYAMDMRGMAVTLKQMRHVELEGQDIQRVSST